MPLKGVLLQATVYRPASLRWLTDVDILVPEADLERVSGAMSDADFACYGHGKHELCCRLEGNPLPVDVHGQLFAPGIFNMPTDALFARAKQDRSLFGVDVWLPDPLDVYAHLIGHLVKSRGLAAPAQHFEDLLRLQAHYGFAAQQCADHLDACGMGRAARYVLARAVSETGDAFAHSVLEALRPDWVGVVLAGVVRQVMPRVPRPSRVGGLVPHLLDRSLLAAAVGVPQRMLAVLSQPRRA